MRIERVDPPTPRAAPPSNDTSSSEPLPTFHPLIETSDLDETRILLNQLYNVARVERAPGRSLFHWRARYASLGPIGILSGAVQGGVTIAAESFGDRYALSLSHSGHAEATVAGTVAPVVAERSGALFAANRFGRLIMPGDFAPLTVSIERAPLDAHFGKLTQVPPRAPLGFAARIQLASGPGAGLWPLILLLIGELERPSGLLASPYMRAALTEALLTGLLTCVPHDRTGLLTAPMPLIAPGCVRRAEAFMEAHAGDPITITQVAEATGVGVRALQAAFRRYRACSPRQFLKERRLELARRRLLCPEPGLTVTAAATIAGYGHAGRFIADYRRRFGESPAETLRRNR